MKNAHRILVIGLLRQRQIDSVADPRETVMFIEGAVAARIIAALAHHGPTIPIFQLKSRRQMRALLDLLGLPA